MLINITDATKAFRGREVFVGLSAQLPHGQVSALVGPSGAGKTTLLTAIAGQLPLDAGVIEWVYPEVGARSPQPADVAWVNQVTHLLDHRSSRDNVAVAALARGQSWLDAQTQAEEWLARFGLSPVADSEAGRLSGGERQRVSICRALATNRPLVLADEPSANLDAYNAGLVLDSFRHLADDGVTVVLASHDPFAVRVATHVESLR